MIGRAINVCEPRWDSTTPVSPECTTQMLVSKIGDLQIPAAILVDEAGFQQLWPGETFGRQESD